MSIQARRWSTRLAPERRATLLALALATLIGALGLAAGGSAGALLGERLAGSDAAAGLPLGLLVLGSAAAAVLVSRMTVRLGRGRSLALGYLIGSAGAALVLAAVACSSLIALLAGSTLLGGANAAIFLTRYAGAAVGGSGRALGTVFAATAVGAVLSAALLGPSGRLAEATGLPRESGLYLVALVAFALAAAVLAAISRRHAALLGAPGAAKRERGWFLAVAPARCALVTLAATNFVMVAVMTVAPLRLRMSGMGLELVGAVIAVHVAGMFAPAPVSGWLADRAGPRVVGVAGAGVLIAAGIAGALWDEDGGMILALALLGVGWNLGVVGASTQLGASVPEALRPHVEGIGEVAMGVAAAAGAPLSGLITHIGGAAALWLVCAAVAGLNLATLGPLR